MAGLAVLAGLALGVLWRRSERARQRLQREHEAADRQQHDLIDALDIGLVVYDREDRLAMWNRDFASLYPALAGRLAVGVPFGELLRHSVAHGLVPEAVGQEEAWLAGRLQRHARAEGTMLRRLADDRWRRITERRLPDGSMLSYSIDVTELVQREQELRRVNADLDAANARLSSLSDTDSLTDIPNRRQFDRRLAEEWARARRHGLPLAVLMVDVDHFKRFNDLHGHVAGDTCLRQVAALLGATARRPADLVARFGGEEFVLLLPHTDLPGALAQAQRCLDAVQAAALPHGDSPVAPHVTLSIGAAALAPSDVASDPQALVRAADAAMYRAKRAGRAQAAGGALATEADA